MQSKCNSFSWAPNITSAPCLAETEVAKPLQADSKILSTSLDYIPIGGLVKHLTIRLISGPQETRQKTSAILRRVCYSGKPVMPPLWELVSFPETESFVLLSSTVSQTL